MTTTRRSPRSILLAALALAACAHAPPPVGREDASRWAAGREWLCLPGREDACAATLDATELAPNGVRAVVRDAPARPSRVDCFYVYPTVDLDLVPGNHTDFSDREPMARATIAQAARFRSVCSLYVPLYRQMKRGTYLRSAEEKKRYLDVAYADVEGAFRWYLAHENRGRKIVLLGHSQGGEMATLLLQRLFDGDAAMRERLLLAMPIGTSLSVPKGRAAGGTFANIPMCTRKGETGCVVGFRSHVAGSAISLKYWAKPPPGEESICVSPAELAHGTPRFSRTFLSIPKQPLFRPDVGEVTTPFVMLRDYYTGRCTDGPDGYRYLAIAAEPPPGDVRPPPYDLGRRIFHGDLGLHVLDYQFPQGDLVDLVAERAAALE